MGSIQYQFMEISSDPSVNGWFASGDHFSMLMMYPKHWWLQLRNHVIRSCIWLDDTRIRWIFFRPFPNLPSAQSTFGHKCLGYDRSSSPEKCDSQVPHVENPGNDQQCMLAVATPFRFRSSRGPLFASWKPKQEPSGTKIWGFVNSDFQSSSQGKPTFQKTDSFG
jgi:hypothetical protein